MTPQKQDELMILGFLDQRIMQAESDLIMYSTMKEEVLKLIRQGKALDRNNKFLKLVTSQQPEQV